MRWPGWPAVITGALAGTALYHAVAWLHPELSANQRKGFGATIFLGIFALVGVVILIADRFDKRSRGRPPARNTARKSGKR